MALHIQYFDAGDFVGGSRCVHEQCFVTKDNRQIHCLVAELTQAHDFEKWDGWISQKCLDHFLHDEGGELDLLADPTAQRGDDEEMSAGNKGGWNSDIAAE
jgi:hypothetical protein